MAIYKRWVIGYACVSDDSDEQFNSYEAQVNYYTKFIKSKPDWELVKIYTDESFKEMIADALTVRIDLIVTD